MITVNSILQGKEEDYKEINSFIVNVAQKSGFFVDYSNNSDFSAVDNILSLGNMAILENIKNYDSSRGALTTYLFYVVSNRLKQEYTRKFLKTHENEELNLNNTIENEDGNEVQKIDLIESNTNVEDDYIENEQFSVLKHNLVTTLKQEFSGKLLEKRLKIANFLINNFENEEYLKINGNMNYTKVAEALGMNKKVLSTHLKAIREVFIYY